MIYLSHGGKKMKTIVLITRENNERATQVSVFLCNSYSEAKHFCHFTNRLSLVGEDKLVARKIIVNAEYSLEKYQPFIFDDFVKLDDRKIQLIMRELDSEMLAISLIDAKEEVKNVFFRNMSKRAASMLEEDIAYWGTVTESDIENARQVTLDIYDDVTGENRFDKAWARYKKIKEKKTKNKKDFDNENYIVLVFRGAGTAAEFVSVYLFDDRDSADNFCYYLNSVEPDKESFIYAVHADQMTEYETTKPLFVSFNNIFKNNGQYEKIRVIREALKKFDANTILKAFKGMDKRLRMLVMQSLPTKTTDEINELIEQSDNDDLCTFCDSRRAQQRMLNMINKTADKFRRYEPKILKD
jgi:hypothetical protein